MWSTVVNFILAVTSPSSVFPALKSNPRVDRDRALLHNVLFQWSGAMVAQAFASMVAFLGLNHAPMFRDFFFDVTGTSFGSFPAGTPDILEGVVLLGFLLRCLLLPYGLVILRRFFILHGVLLGIRAFTILLTPYPNAMPECVNIQPIAALSPGNLVHLFLLFPGHTCGDYVYSGHTVLFVLTAVFWQRCVRPLGPWYALEAHAMTLVAVLGIVSLPVFRFHYSVDCIIGMYVAYFAAGYFWQLVDGDERATGIPRWFFDIDTEGADDPETLASMVDAANPARTSFCPREASPAGVG
eukprot:TRINITY_DN2660_c0_g1_i2.p1 TRINITY_DN2660_c0_g1~~TRINITY_DN2660_c0_g1_i2.p1  ORF type:complete len:297 (+),score=34.28 TRINITY_DN2660_c0_g1_i2:284-1174(+)